MNLWQYLLNIFIVLFFILLNGFFVAAEFAIVKVRYTQIEYLVQKGNWRAKIAQDLLKNLNTYLSATQLGITMTSLALGWIGQPLTADMLQPFFQLIGIKQNDLIHGISFVIAFALITSLHIIVGEQAPKFLAIQKARETILMVSSPLRLFYFLFKPVITLLNVSSNGLLKLAGLQFPSGSELMHSEEELRLIISKDMQASTTSKNIALKALDFHQKQARHAMIPRREISALSIQTPVQESLDILRKKKFSRFPVFKETIDNIIGIVYIKDIFKFDKHLQPDFTLHSVLRDASFLPETATLEKVLTTILQKKTHMIILADEYGGTAGLITLENVLEELVGNIQDEYDRETPDVVKVSDNEFIVTGSITTNDVERSLGVDLSLMDIRSIGGFLIEQLGHIPKVGEQLHKHGLEFTIEKVVDNTIEVIRIKRIHKQLNNE